VGLESNIEKAENINFSANLTEPIIIDDLFQSIELALDRE